MRIGITANDSLAGVSVEQIANFTQQMEKRGFDTVWMSHVLKLDAITALAVAAYVTSKIELGTAVTTSYPRHPSAVAQQALTVSAISDGRFTLGLGLSHKMLVEDMLGLSYAKPAKHMREYLEVLHPLLNLSTVSYEGEQYKTNIELDVPGAKPVPVLVAALGPAMLAIAGRLGDGVTTWMTGPNTLEELTIPTVMKSATDTPDRGSPRVVAGFPILLTDDADAGREFLASKLGMYGQLPSYKASLKREGVESPVDIALVGNKKVLRQKLGHLRDIGVTDLRANIMAPSEDLAQATMDFLQGELS